MKVVSQKIIKIAVSSILSVILMPQWFWLLADSSQYKILNILKNRFNFRMKVYCVQEGNYIGDIELENVDLSHFGLNEDFLSKHYMQVASLKMGLRSYAHVIPRKADEKLQAIDKHVKVKPLDNDYFCPPGVDLTKQDNARSQQILN